MHDAAAALEQARKITHRTPVQIDEPLQPDQVTEVEEPAQTVEPAPPWRAFLDDFFGETPRHVCAIKKPPGGKPIISARSFLPADSAACDDWIKIHEGMEFDLYFMPNPAKTMLGKKATKADIREARWLYVDLDPLPGINIDVAREKMIALLTTDLPPGIPQPTFIIDSGRGFWGFWKLATPQPVDGDGSATARVEARGRGIAEAFTKAGGVLVKADACFNIDRIARLPGTINHKTNKRAGVGHE